MERTTCIGMLSILVLVAIAPAMATTIVIDDFTTDGTHFFAMDRPIDLSPYAPIETLAAHLVITVTPGQVRKVENQQLVYHPGGYYYWLDIRRDADDWSAYNVKVLVEETWPDSYDPVLYDVTLPFRDTDGNMNYGYIENGPVVLYQHVDDVSYGTWRTVQEAVFVIHEVEILVNEGVATEQRSWGAVKSLFR